MISEKVIYRSYYLGENEKYLIFFYLVGIGNLCKYRNGVI